MRYSLAAVVVLACGKDAAPPVPPVARVVDARVDAEAALPAHETYPDLAAALLATIPADARVVGIGELHARTDRAAVRSSLAAFTAVVPALGDRVSDLVIETWIVDPKCGKAAVTATAKVETAVRRPEATKSEIGKLADAAKAAKIQPHAMTLGCADYVVMAPTNGEVDPVALLTLTTRELKRLATSIVAHRDAEPAHRPWIAVYGGALHNDRFPAAGTAEWSYAAEADRVTHDHFVEVDLIVPEFAEADATAKAAPWFPLVAANKAVSVWKRGDRSFVILLPRS